MIWIAFGMLFSEIENCFLQEEYAEMVESAGGERETGRELSIKSSRVTSLLMIALTQRFQSRNTYIVCAGREAGSRWNSWERWERRHLFVAKCDHAVRINNDDGARKSYKNNNNNNTAMCRFDGRRVQVGVATQQWHNWTINHKSAKTCEVINIK